MLHTCANANGAEARKISISVCAILVKSPGHVARRAPIKVRLIRIEADVRIAAGSDSA